MRNTVLAPHPNRGRTALLDAFAAGRVYRSMSGCILLKAPNGRNNQRVDRRARELIEAGWAEPGAGTTYAITADGERARVEGHRLIDQQRAVNRPYPITDPPSTQEGTTQPWE